MNPQSDQSKKKGDDMKKLLLFGDDNGSCTLYKLTQGEYDSLHDRLIEDDDDAEAAEKELAKAEIEVEYDSYGYIPGWAIQLAEIYGFGYDSN